MADEIYRIRDGEPIELGCIVSQTAEVTIELATIDPDQFTEILGTVVSEPDEDGNVMVHTLMPYTTALINKPLSQGNCPYCCSRLTMKLGEGLWCEGCLNSF